MTNAFNRSDEMDNVIDPMLNTIAIFLFVGTVAAD